MRRGGLEQPVARPLALHCRRIDDYKPRRARRQAIREPLDARFWVSTADVAGQDPKGGPQRARHLGGRLKSGGRSSLAG